MDSNPIWQSHSMDQSGPFRPSTVERGESPLSSAMSDNMRTRWVNPSMPLAMNERSNWNGPSQLMAVGVPSNGLPLHLDLPPATVVDMSRFRDRENRLPHERRQVMKQDSPVPQSAPVQPPTRDEIREGVQGQPRAQLNNPNAKSTKDGRTLFRNNEGQPPEISPEHAAPEGVYQEIDEDYEILRFKLFIRSLNQKVFPLPASEVPIVKSDQLQVYIKHGKNILTREKSSYHKGCKKVMRAKSEEEVWQACRDFGWIQPQNNGDLNMTNAGIYLTNEGRAFSGHIATGVRELRKDLKLCIAELEDYHEDLSRKYRYSRLPKLQEKVKQHQAQKAKDELKERARKKKHQVSVVYTRPRSKFAKTFNISNALGRKQKSQKPEQSAMPVLPQVHTDINENAASEMPRDTNGLGGETPVPHVPHAHLDDNSPITSSSKFDMSGHNFNDMSGIGVNSPGANIPYGRQQNGSPLVASPSEVFSLGPDWVFNKAGIREPVVRSRLETPIADDPKNSNHLQDAQRRQLEKPLQTLNNQKDLDNPRHHNYQHETSYDTPNSQPQSLQRNSQCENAIGNNNEVISGRANEPTEEHLGAEQALASWQEAHYWDPAVEEHLSLESGVAENQELEVPQAYPSIAENTDQEPEAVEPEVTAQSTLEAEGAAEYKDTLDDYDWEDLPEEILAYRGDAYQKLNGEIDTSAASLVLPSFIRGNSELGYLLEMRERFGMEPASRQEFHQMIQDIQRERMRGRSRSPSGRYSRYSRYSCNSRHSHHSHGGSGLDYPVSIHSTHSRRSHHTHSQPDGREQPAQGEQPGRSEHPGPNEQLNHEKPTRTRRQRSERCELSHHEGLVADGQSDEIDIIDPSERLTPRRLATQNNIVNTNPFMLQDRERRNASNNQASSSRRSKEIPQIAREILEQKPVRTGNVGTRPNLNHAPGLGPHSLLVQSMEEPTPSLHVAVKPRPVAAGRWDYPDAPSPLRINRKGPDASAHTITPRPANTGTATPRAVVRHHDNSLSGEEDGPGIRDLMRASISTDITEMDLGTTRSNNFDPFYQSRHRMLSQVDLAANEARMREELEMAIRTNPPPSSIPRPSRPHR